MAVGNVEPFCLRYVCYRHRVHCSVAQGRNDFWDHRAVGTCDSDELLNRPSRTSSV